MALELERMNCSCVLEPHITDFSLFSLCNLPLVPSWLVAVFLGLYFSVRFASLGSNVTGSLAYALTFALYGIMITSGLVVHCIYLVECGGEPASQGYRVFGKIDCSLTSSIAISFLLNGLVDLRLIKDHSWTFIGTSLLLYTATFSLYFCTPIPTLALYMISVVVCCGMYLVCQLAVMLERPGYLSLATLTCLLLAGVFGGGSLWAIRAHYCWLCEHLGPWSVQGVWYYGSDLAMFCIGLYVWGTRTMLTTPTNGMRRKE